MESKARTIRPLRGDIRSDAAAGAEGAHRRLVTVGRAHVDPGQRTLRQASHERQPEVFVAHRGVWIVEVVGRRLRELGVELRSRVLLLHGRHRLEQTRNVLLRHRKRLQPEKGDVVRQCLLHLRLRHSEQMRAVGRPAFGEITVPVMGGSIGDLIRLFRIGRRHANYREHPVLHGSLLTSRPPAAHRQQGKREKDMCERLHYSKIVRLIRYWADLFPITTPVAGRVHNAGIKPELTTSDWPT